MNLRDRAVLITGARRGIGMAAARSAVAAGATVFLHARRRDQAEEAARTLGAGAVPVWAELSDLAEIRRMVDEAGSRLGRLDGVVNNAGGAVVAPSAQFAEGDWDMVFDVNVKAAFFVSVAALPYLQRSASPAVVNISSLHADTAIVGRAAYAAAKAAVNQLSRSLAIEWAPHRIRVNAVAPGFVNTERIADLVSREGRNLAARTPLGRLADPGEIAAAVIFLLSDASSFVTGETLRVDGGWTAYGDWRIPGAHR